MLNVVDVDDYTLWAIGGAINMLLETVPKGEK